MTDEQTPAPQLNKIEIRLVEAEVIKLDAKPGSTLLFKFKGEEFCAEDVINVIGKQLRNLLPDYKVVAMALPEGHDVELTNVENQDKVEEVKDCSKPTSYCNDCSCGKKERIEGEKT